MVTLFAGISIGQEIGFTHPIILTMFALTIITFISFLYVETHVTAPILSLHIFKNMRFTLSIICAFLIFVTNFFFNVIAPFYLENALGMAANYAGYTLMIFPLVNVVVAPVSGTISDKIGSEKLTFIGLIIILFAQLGYIVTNVATPLWLFMFFIGLNGLGNGIFQAPNNALVMGSVEPKELGVAGGINALARELGMVVGISFATTVLFSAMSKSAGRTVTSYIPGHPEIFIAGMHVAFIVSFIICLVSIVITSMRLFKKARI